MGSTISVSNNVHLSVCVSLDDVFALFERLNLLYKQFRMKLWVAHFGEDLFSCISAGGGFQSESDTAKEALRNSTVDRVSG